MAARRTWIERSVDTFHDELASFGLDAPRQTVAAGIRGHLRSVAERLGVAEQSARPYLSDEVLRYLARELAIGLADEQPGADLTTQPRNVPTPLASFGQTIAALAEAGRVRARGDDPDDPDDIFQLISLLGSLLSRAPGPKGDVSLPQAALTRSARYLEATVELVQIRKTDAPDIPGAFSPSVVDAFARDASVLRGLVMEHGLRNGPSPMQ
jgi:hypothetical protein